MAKEWVPVGPAADLMHQPVTEWWHDQTPYLITFIDGQFHAFINVCTHQELVMSPCEWDDGELVCPWHSVSYHAATGAVANDMGRMHIKGLTPVQVEVRGDVLYLSPPEGRPRNPRTTPSMR